MTADPLLVGLKDAEQLEVVVLRLARVQDEFVNAPAAPVTVKVTVPAGADAVPATEVSLTNAVQLVA